MTSKTITIPLIGTKTLGYRIVSQWTEWASDIGDVRESQIGKVWKMKQSMGHVCCDRQMNLGRVSSDVRRTLLAWICYCMVTRDLLIRVTLWATDRNIEWFREVKVMKFMKNSCASVGVRCLYWGKDKTFWSQLECYSKFTIPYRDGEKRQTKKQDSDFGV